MPKTVDEEYKDMEKERFFFMERLGKSRGLNLRNRLLAISE